MLLDRRTIIETAHSWIWQLRARRSDESYIFIFGAPRSGTTLLQKIVEAHPNCFSISGETGLFTSQNLFDPNRHLFGIEPARLEQIFADSSDVVGFFENCVSEIAGKQNGKIFIEKTPQHVLRAKFLIKHFPKAKMIHVVRDGRDCFCSAQTNSNVPQRASAPKFARYWRRCVKAGVSAESHSAVKRVRYEQLVVEPKTVIADMMEFLGFEAKAGQESQDLRGLDPRADHAAFEMLKRPISDTSVSRWENDMSEVEKVRFEEIAGRELESLGYSV